ncbi:hypothetical protein SAMN05216227_1004107 [Pseudorhodobacter antarcticus]|uniref:Uncharacterized protein n=1 Tax=Pseudorhodobacter antarcticus TaxID=1077947 RepID=A0A1H8CBQ6_9RHOB|nr:Ig-like domain-containing protein [Pseudorhodobacter antarcticus]SEM91537.1 hypothetical protein SAMN05216227_1004107 [Pseudorhodobacter antarcticus]
MVKAIDFAVRTSADKLVNGAVSGDGGSQFLQVGSGETVSLNLSQSSVLGYERQGTDLILKLADGREITLSGYFESNPGEDNKLYLSSNGDVTEVFLTDGGDGTMYANYGAVDTWNKYSNVDDIRFTDENSLASAGYADDTVGMGAFAPGLLGGGGGGLGLAAAGLGGLGLLGALAGGGGGGGTPTTGGPAPVTPTPTTPTVPVTPVRIPPTVNDPAATKDVSTVTPEKNPVVSGTGQPGETVVVKLGDKTQTTTIKDDGKWETKFEGPNDPGEGKFEAVVTVTPGNGRPAEVLDGPGFVIDRTSVVSTTDGTTKHGAVENLVEYADGVTVKGEGEPGARIEATLTATGGKQSVVVGTDGKWEVTFTQTQIPGGDYKEIDVTIIATDKMGNVSLPVNEKIAIDTVPHTITFDTVAGDNVVSKLESDGSVTVSGKVSGTASSDAMVNITLNNGGGSQDVKAVNGTWSVTYPKGTFTVDGDRSFSASTIDAAGNKSVPTTHTIKVDVTATVAFTPGNMPGDTNGDGTLNAAETSNGVTMTGTAEVGSRSVTVMWNGFPQTTTNIDAAGNWSVTFPQAQMPVQGSVAAATTRATVTAVDQYGNTSEVATRDVKIDRETSVFIDGNQTANGDNIITAAEKANGVNLTGKAETGSMVDVTYQGKTVTVTAVNGSWSANFPDASLKSGTFMTDGANTRVTVTSTDPAGNKATATPKLVFVDTEVPLTAGTDSYNSIKADNILNHAEAGRGLTVTGTVEAGSVVKLKLGNGAEVTVNVSGENWSYTFTGNQIPGANNTTAPGGAITADLVVTATDGLGNKSEPYRETITIDRTVTPFTLDGTIGGDNILNATEVANGVNLTGTGELGAVGKVALSNGQSQSFTVGIDGKWQVGFDAAQMPRGNNERLNFTFESTDAAGDVTSFPVNNVLVDTVAPDSVDIVQFTKDSQLGLVGIRLDEAVNVNDFTAHRVDHNGNHSAINFDIGTSPGGLTNDTMGFNRNPVPEGNFLVVNHADAAGNNSATLYLTNNSGTATNINLNDKVFKDFDFTQLDLTAAKTTLSISAEQLVAMTGPDNTLIIKGGIDDTVNLVGGKLGSTTGVPAGFVHYTLDGHSLYIEDDIKPNF